MSLSSVYSYISTRADYDPVKMFIVFPPYSQAKTYAGAEKFAETSGWRAIAEFEGAALIIPVINSAWKTYSTKLPGDIFDEYRGHFGTKNGRSLNGREGKLWCWETMIYLIGYEDGATFAGNCAVAHPNRFASVALIGGAPDDYSEAELPSDHWMVKDVSEDYCITNNMVPGSIWMINAETKVRESAVEYFNKVNNADSHEEIAVEGIKAKRWYNAKYPARQVLVSDSDTIYDFTFSFKLYKGLFEKTIRWKSAPDGTLRFHPTREEYYNGSEYEIDAVCVNILDYPYSVRLPKGMTKEEVKGLPLLYTVHGRGEPAWMFCSKNGWDKLQDETRGFVLAVPDSTGNIWQLKRDGSAFKAMTDKICDAYQLDKTRVYLTGFSNGATITREVGTAFPALFAAISPWNGPVVPESELMLAAAVSDELTDKGYEMPYWVVVGDNDPVTKDAPINQQLDVLIRANGCKALRSETEDGGYVPDEIRDYSYYSQSKGYKEGDRMYTRVYRAADGHERVAYTVIKNMSHGAMHDEARAAWDFLKHFSRKQDSKTVIYT